MLPFYFIALAMIGILAVQYRTFRPSGQRHQLIPIGSGLEPWMDLKDA